MNPPTTLLEDHLKAKNADVSRLRLVPDLDPSQRRHLRLVIDEPVDAPVAPAATTTTYAQYGKRALDILIAVPMLLLVLPILLIGALVVLLTLGRPIIYRQRRVGRGGHPFEIIKLRTMRPEAVVDLSGSEAVLDVTDRTTPATRILRRLSLDEFSQLWNVIRGDMSLVGPRPEVWTKAVRHGLVAHQRNQVRPGMTGAWQITPARNGEIRDGVEHDLRYIDSVSLTTDLRILSKTPAAMVRSETD